jgi:hypothetical protein
VASFSPRGGAQAATDTAEVLLVAQGKLPDDLAFDEFGDVIEAVRVLVSFGYYAGSGQSRWDETELPDAEVTKVQYGSDFLTYIVIAGAVGVSLKPLGQLIESLANAFDRVQDGLLKREQRLAKKEERLRNRRLSENSIDTDSAEAMAALSSLGWGPEQAIQQTSVAGLRRLSAAVALLARYRVSVKIKRRDGSDEPPTFISPLG